MPARRRLEPAGDRARGRAAQRAAPASSGTTAASRRRSRRSPRAGGSGAPSRRRPKRAARNRRIGDEHDEDFGPKGRRRRRALLLTGLVLLGAVVAELTIVTLADTGAGAAMWRGTGVEVFAGREAGIPMSLGGGAPAWLVAQVSATQDIAIVCFAYPAFLWLLARHRDKDNLLMRRLRRIEDKAAKKEETVRRWGPVAIFGFMLVPFLLNGPLIGAVLGRMSGLATRYLVAPVVAATVVNAFAWTYFYDFVFSLAGDLHPAVPPALTAVLVGTVVAWNLVSEVRALRKERAEA